MTIEEANERQEPEWTFRKDLQPGSKKTNPQTGREFERLGPLHALVGETIQNELDAGDGDGPVISEVGIWGGECSIPKDKASEYFGPELRTHISRVQEGTEFYPHQRLETFDQDMEYVTIEDFGTVGLTGRVDQFGIPYMDMPKHLKKELNENRFLWYNRAQNATSDDQDRRGSWGEGKFTIEGASRLGAQISWSIRADESQPKQVLMGQTTLRWHGVYKPPEYGRLDENGEIEPDNFAPFGFFSTSKLEDTGVDYAPLPVDDLNYISRFKETFNMVRDDEPGLSILIPHPDEEILCPDAFARSVIARWLIAIYSGELIVRIRHNGKLIHELSQDTLRAVIPTLDWDLEPYWTGSKGEPNPAYRSTDMWLGFLDLLDSVEALSEEDCFDIDPTGSTSTGPSWANPFGLQGEETVDRFRERFNSGDPILIRAHPNLAPYVGLVEGEFQIILRKVDAELSTQYFAREMMGIPFVKGDHDEVLAIVHCNDDHLGPQSLRHLLRDSEGPAHLQWSPNASRVVRKARKWWMGGAGVRYVIDSIGSLLEHSKIPPEEEEHAVSLFSITISGTEQKTPAEPPVGPGPINPPPPKQPPICTIPSRGYSQGVRVRRHKEYSLAGKTIQIDLAYETKGNPWSKYSELDFSVDDITHVANGAEFVMAASKPTSKNGLVMTFEVQSDDWKIDLSGFGTDRDIAVDVKEVE